MLSPFHSLDAALYTDPSGCFFPFWPAAPVELCREWNVVGEISQPYGHRSPVDLLWYETVSTSVGPA